MWGLWGAGTWSVGPLLRHRFAVWTWGSAGSNLYSSVTWRGDTDSSLLLSFLFQFVGCDKVQTVKLWTREFWKHLPDSTGRDPFNSIMPSPVPPTCTVATDLLHSRGRSESGRGGRGGATGWTGPHHLTQQTGLCLSLVSPWALRNCGKLTEV